ncbi:MAG: DNA internalization-related competence protein ComEC/Rec2 [Lachnospiraceae bacterium]|nr:DNA internalization-related competence protein ComEC/Rec2 [Lachnospiraceae bacterium]
MKRPMCILAVAWLAGLFTAGWWPEFELKYSVLFFLFLVFIGCFILKKHPQIVDAQVKMEWYPQLTLLLLLVPCLFVTGNLRMEQVLKEREQKERPWKLYEEEGETYVTVQGIILEKNCGEQVTFVLTDCVIIGYYGQENQSAGNCRVKVETEGKEWLPETFVGNEVKVFGKFSVFQPAGNPGQFDAYKYYTGKDLYADIEALRVTILDDGKSVIGHTLFLLKQRMRERLQTLYPVQKAGVLAAMMLGDKDLLPEDIEELYQQNGISHILAISGLHISMLCMGLFRVLRKIGISQKIAVTIAVCFLVFYIIYTGASTSSFRAGVMCLVMFGAKLFRRSYDLLSSLSVAAMVVSLIRPTELFSAGFLLSFSAVLGVAAAQEVERSLEKENREKKVWWNAFVFGGVLQCMTIPISLYFFYELSPYSILLNLVVIPFVALILAGGMFSMLLGMVVPVVAKIPAGGTYLLLEFYERLGEMTQKLPFSVVLVGRPELWQIVVYYIVLSLVLKGFFVYTEKRIQKTEERARSVGIFALGMLLTTSILLLPDSNSAQLLFLDVSQGDGALIYTEEGTVILSDCGSSDVSKVGEYRLSPVLKQNGTLLIDIAVVSHLDSDHTSGIKELLTNMTVYRGRFAYVAGYKGEIGIRELVLPKVQVKSETYLELEALAEEKNVTLRYMEASDVLYQEEEMLIECLYPCDAKESENDTSLVFLLQTPQVVAWLMGDAGIAPEMEIMERLAAVNMNALNGGKLVVLKVGHHGSKTSSGEEFIAFVQPDISVISCGYENSYGHPHASVVERLEGAESRVFRTDLQGAVLVELGKEIKVHGYKE